VIYKKEKLLQHIRVKLTQVFIINDLKSQKLCRSYRTLFLFIISQASRCASAWAMLLWSFRPLKDNFFKVSLFHGLKGLYIIAQAEAQREAWVIFKEMIEFCKNDIIV